LIKIQVKPIITNEAGMVNKKFCAKWRTLRIQEPQYFCWQKKKSNVPIQATHNHSFQVFFSRSFSKNQEQTATNEKGTSRKIVVQTI
ncbi:MAG: hypothetical protein ACOYXC_00340, partial [Candidatus Rifleibacteriota bacterium]